MFDVVGLLMWLVGMRLAHFSLHCKDSGFSRQQRCEVVLFSLLLQSCFELNSQSLDLITQQALGSVLALACKPQCMAWHRVGSLMLEFRFGIVRSMKGNHKELSIVDTLAACEHAVWGATTRAQHGWGVQKGYAAGVLHAEETWTTKKRDALPFPDSTALCEFVTQQVHSFANPFLQHGFKLKSPMLRAFTGTGDIMDLLLRTGTQ